MKSPIMLCIALCISASLQAQLIVMSFFSNEPEFVKLQYKTLKKFLPPHRYIVFNDALDKKDRMAIKFECKRRHIECINVPREIHKTSYLPLPAINQKLNPYVRKAVTLHFALEKIGYDHNDILMIIDPRVLPIKPFDVTTYMLGLDIATIMKSFENLNYMWPGLTILDMNQIPDRYILTFDFNDQNFSIGAYSHYYLAAHPNLRIKLIDSVPGSRFLCPYNVPFNETSPINERTITAHEQQRLLSLLHIDQHEIDFLLKKPANIDFFLDGHFLYYRGYSPYNLCADFINSILH